MGQPKAALGQRVGQHHRLQGHGAALPVCIAVALGKPGLQTSVSVTTDLIASNQVGAQQVNQALSDLERETGRLAMNLEPVRMNTDEKGPAREAIDEIAQAYTGPCAIRGR